MLIHTEFIFLMKLMNTVFFMCNKKGINGETGWQKEVQKEALIFFGGGCIVHFEIILNFLFVEEKQNKKVI